MRSTNAWKIALKSTELAILSVFTQSMSGASLRLQLQALSRFIPWGRVGVALTRDGEVWTWGLALGQQSRATTFVQGAFQAAHLSRLVTLFWFFLQAFETDGLWSIQSGIGCKLTRLSLLEVGGGEKAWKSAFDLQRSAPKLLFEQFAFLADFGRGLRWQFPTQKRQQQLVVLFGLRVATKYQLPPVGGWEVHVQHLDGRELFQ